MPRIAKAPDSGNDFKWPVSAERTIAATSHKVWKAISRRGNLELAHPFCASNPVSVWPGPDSRDEVHYLSGWVYERRFRQWYDGVGYDLEIGRPGGGISRVSWRIRPVTDQSCSLRISVFPHAVQHISVAIRWIPHLLSLRPKLRLYLESVVKGFEWYVTRQEPVPRNAFGKHPWFSAR